MNIDKEKNMIGKCLCGKVQFTIEGDVPDFYQCHCSLCRKATGTASSTATFINKNNLVWQTGEKYISKFSHESGFRSNFCSHCGSPVPNIMKDTELYWVPGGLLDETKDSEIKVHIFTDSKADWDTPASTGTHYGEKPGLEILYKLLHQDK